MMMMMMMMMMIIMVLKILSIITKPIHLVKYFKSVLIDKVLIGVDIKIIFINVTVFEY